MKNLIKIGSFFLLLAIMASCKTPTPKDLLKENLIPKPTSITATGSSFELNSETVIYIANDSEKLMNLANYFSAFLNPATGFALAVEISEEVSKSNGIFLTLSSDNNFGDEGYKLNISEKNITLLAKNIAGLFNGIQTIKQLLPPSIESNKIEKGPWEIATGEIVDSPEYGYRGAMLDVSRHFFDVKDVKRFIDLISTYKMNVLHLHLSDDQGWRIEIKSWPKLTTIGGKTEVGGGEGGFYTQEEYKDIVKYAEERNITIIPEIDMPGHTNAALASYPELNSDGVAPELYTGTEVGFSTLATRKDITYKFVEDVIRELAEITPGAYIHIGGDESHVTKKEDYIYFINKVQKIVEKNGKLMMGWADISAAELNKNSVAQFWQKKPDNAINAINQGVKILMSPATLAYLDMQYDSTCPLGLHWTGYIEVDKAYNWKIDKYVDEITKENIIGIEAPLWTETVKNMDDIEFMVFPRLLGFAELGWSKNSEKSWEEYNQRLGKQKKRFEFMDINYYKSPVVSWDECDTIK